MDNIQATEPALHFDEFPIPTYEEWQAAAVASLGGKPFDTLITPTYEGIPLQPLYRREDVAEIATDTLPGQPPYLRGVTAAGYLTKPWAIAQELTYGSPAVLNRALLHDLERGQTVVNMILDRPTQAGIDPDTAEPGQVGRGGVSLATIEDLAVALDGVDLAAVPLFVRSGTTALPLLALLIAFLRRTGKGSADLHGCLENDPLGELAQAGTLPLSLDRAYDEMAQVTLWASEHAPGLATFAIHAQLYHNSGGNAVQELAFGLATGVSYLRALIRRGVELSTAAPRIRFDFAVGGNFFMEIAKLRAARLLWSQVVAAFGGNDDAQLLRLHARTGYRNKTVISPYVNMIRATTEALVAAVGGVDSLHVAPFDEPLRPPDEFSRRIARNIQIILQEEAFLVQVIDPAGGSYAVEALTDRLAREAWALFQEVERQGGMADALKLGYVQSQIAAVADQRSANLAIGSDVIIGVNRFADPDGAPPIPDESDYDALNRERVAQITSHRAGRGAAHTTALDRLSKTAAIAPGETVQAAIVAAQAGATLGEITRVLNAYDGARLTIVPLSRMR